MRKLPSEQRTEWSPEDRAAALRYWYDQLCTTLDRLDSAIQWMLGLTPAELLAHYDARFDPVRPGDRLHVSCQSVAGQQIRDAYNLCIGYVGASISDEQRRGLEALRDQATAHGAAASADSAGEGE